MPEIKLYDTYFSEIRKKCKLSFNEPATSSGYSRSYIPEGSSTVILCMMQGLLNLTPVMCRSSASAEKTQNRSLQC